MATAVRARGSGRRLWSALRIGACALVVGGLGFAAFQVHPATVAIKGPDTADWHGQTAQRLPVAATINGRWLDSFRAQVELRCDRGARPESLTWAPSPDRFVQEGDDVTATQPARTERGTDGWTLSTEGRLDMVVGASPHGTASVLVRWARGDSYVMCRSGPVAFSLARGTT